MKIKCPHCGNTINKKAFAKKGMAVIMVQVNYVIKCPNCQQTFNHYSAFGTEFDVPNENVLQEKLA